MFVTNNGDTYTGMEMTTCLSLYMDRYANPVHRMVTVYAMASATVCGKDQITISDDLSVVFTNRRMDDAMFLITVEFPT